MSTFFRNVAYRGFARNFRANDLGRLGKYELVPKIKKPPFFGYTKKIQKKYKNYTLFLELATPKKGKMLISTVDNFFCTNTVTVGKTNLR